MNALINQMLGMDKKPTVVASQAFQVFDSGSDLPNPIKTQDEASLIRGGNRLRGTCKKIPVGSKDKKQSHKTLGGSMTITWFHGLCLSEMDSLLNYPESLLLVTESGSTVGKFYCSVKKSVLNGDPCLLVHSGSCSMMHDGLECGTTITGFIDYGLKTIQEFTHEWIKLKDKSLERKFFLMREPDKKQYFCQNVVRENGEVRDDKSFVLSFSEMTNVVSESASVILQRIIVQQKKTGEIDLKALTFKGTIVRSNFRVLGSGFENIRGQEMQVSGVRRTIFDGKDVEEWDSIYNQHARLVLRCQPDKDFALIPLWFKPVEEYDVNTKEFIGTRPPLMWACDMELYSQYLERKELLASSHKEYLLRNPQLRALIADFVQAVLMKKPAKVIDFACSFFQPYLKKHSEINLPVSDSDSDKEGGIGEEEEEYLGEQSGTEFLGEFDPRYNYPPPPSAPHQVDMGSEDDINYPPYYGEPGQYDNNYYDYQNQNRGSGPNQPYNWRQSDANNANYYNLNPQQEQQQYYN